MIKILYQYNDNLYIVKKDNKFYLADIDDDNQMIKLKDKGQSLIKSLCKKHKINIKKLTPIEYEK